jgi:hypothetical protein
MWRAPIQGYRDVRHLASLARTLREAGLATEGMGAVFGGSLRGDFWPAVG